MTLDSKTFQDKVATLRNRFNSALRNYHLSDQPNYLYDPIRYVLKGEGKRLRPILVYLVGSVYNADDSDLINAGLAAELLHNFTLVHDDIMDQDEFRHGQLTIHKKWDESTAILAGDGIYAIAQLFITEVKINQLHAVKAFNKATLFVCEGQAYDKEFEHNHSITLDNYLLMIEKKTGWLIGLCAELGGILGNQDLKTIDQLHRYGLNLGNAFQIQDDIFEIFSDDKAMGKSLGSDIVSGKQTILSILARAADPDGWDKTWNKIQKLNLSGSIDYLRSYLVDLDVLDEASQLAKQYIEAAKRDLTIIPVKKRVWLECFTEVVLNRKK
ncbi:MAG: polyprenyl synthetase family protein [Candidatus Neomarinimicrobiota bacterium]